MNRSRHCYRLHNVLKCVLSLLIMMQSLTTKIVFSSCDDCAGIGEIVNDSTIKNKVSSYVSNAQAMKCLITDSVTNMDKLFQFSLFQGDLSCWNTASVTTMEVRTTQLSHTTVMENYLFDTYVIIYRHIPLTYLHYFICSKPFMFRTLPEISQHGVWDQ